MIEVTADYILRNADNLDLAVDIETAMPLVRARLIVRVLHSVRISLLNELNTSSAGTSEWLVQSEPRDLTEPPVIPASKRPNILSKGTYLILRKRSWTGANGQYGQTGVIISADKKDWQDVWLGVNAPKSPSARQLEIRSLAIKAEPECDEYDPAPELPAWYYLGECDGLQDYADWSSLKFLQHAIRIPSDHDSGVTEVVAEISQRLVRLAHAVEDVLER